MYGSTFVSGWCGYYLAGKTAPAGRILVFDDQSTYGLHVFTRRERLSPAITPGTDGYELFADDNDNEPVLAQLGQRFRVHAPVWPGYGPIENEAASTAASISS